MGDIITLELDVDFETITCCKCGIIFAVAQIIKQKWQDNGNDFFCPSCGTAQRYSKSKISILQDEIENLKRQMAANKDGNQEDIPERKKIFGLFEKK